MEQDEYQKQLLEKVSGIHGMLKFFVVVTMIMIIASFYIYVFSQ